jgi:hypothetical protein
MARDWWFIAGDAYAFRFPETCACCGVQTADRWDQVPYCKACRAHVPRFGPVMIALAAAVVGVVTALGMRRYVAFVPWFVHVGAVLLAAVALPVVAMVAGKRRRVGAPHVDHEQAVEITRGGMLVRSERWAEEVAKRNGSAATRTADSSIAVFERVLPWLGALLPVLFAMYWYADWHVKLWIDNGTERGVVIYGDGHALAEVAAGDKARVTIPRGAVHLTSSAGDDATIDARVTGGDWLLNVGGAHCYELQTYGYGESESTLFFATEPQRYQERLFNVAATWYFEPPPKTITITKDPATPPLRGLPHYRSALQIVPCR